MKFHKKFFAFIIIMFCILYGYNVYNNKTHVLKKPLFLKDYIASSGKSDIKLYYIDNINSNRTIREIEFPGVNDDSMVISNNYDLDKKGFYKLSMFYVHLKKVDKVITKAKVRFSDNTVFNVSIGKINLKNNEPVNNELIKNSCSGTYSIADKDYKLVKVETEFNGLINKVSLKINDTLVDNLKLPINIKKGQFYSFIIKTQKSDEKIFNFPVKFFLEDSDGKTYIQEVDINEEHISLDDKIVHSLKLEAGK